jgi:glycosyltransferase involved in cell wall biosynthesis
MNILMANATWYPTGGDWTYIDSVNKLYEKHGHKIIPFAAKNPKNFKTEFDEYFVDGIDYKMLNENKSLANGIDVVKRSIYSIQAKKNLQRLIQDHKIDYAQLHNIHNVQTPSIVSVLKQAKIKTVWRILDYKLVCPNRTFLAGDNICQDCFKHKYYQCAFNKCKKGSFSASLIAAAESYFYYMFPFKNDIDAFLFQNQFMKDLFVKYGFDKNKCHVIENPYDCSLDIPIYQGKDYILYFGRLSPEKGIITLLESMKMLPNIKLKIIGNGPLSDEAIQFVSSNNMQNIEFLGAKYGAELDIVLKDALFTVVPSEWLEPSPYVVLQSYANGKPVIANDIGGLTNLVKHGVTGMLSTMKDANSLASCIRTMYLNREKTEQMGVEARQMLERDYNPDKYYHTTMQLFEQL